MVSENTQYHMDWVWWRSDDRVPSGRFIKWQSMLRGAVMRSIARLYLDTKSWRAQFHPHIASHIVHWRLTGSYVSCILFTVREYKSLNFLWFTRLIFPGHQQSWVYIVGHAGLSIPFSNSRKSAWVFFPPLQLIYWVGQVYGLCGARWPEIVHLSTNILNQKYE